MRHQPQDVRLVNSRTIRQEEWSKMIAITIPPLMLCQKKATLACIICCSRCMHAMPQFFLVELLLSYQVFTNSYICLSFQYMFFLDHVSVRLFIFLVFSMSFVFHFNTLISVILTHYLWAICLNNCLHMVAASPLFENWCVSCRHSIVSMSPY